MFANSEPVIADVREDSVTKNREWFQGLSISSFYATSNGVRTREREKQPASQEFRQASANPGLVGS